MDKKAAFRTALMFLLLGFLVVFGVASFIANLNDEQKITGQTINVNQHNTIKVPNSQQEVPNEDEGTIVLWTKPPVEIFDQFSDTRDYIIFFSATNVPGLRIVYNIRDSRFEAGTPLLSSHKVDIFDGSNHQIVYTFKKGVEQAIFLDGVKVNSSDFKPLKITQITGFIIAVQSVPDADISGLEVDMYDRYMEADDLKKI
jgi:hypothetical protein